jgi:peroxiredoxin Q/BCP
MAFGWYHYGVGPDCVSTTDDCRRLESFLKIKYGESSIKILIIFSMLSILALLIASQLARAGELPKIGAIAPDFSLPDQNGKVYTLADFQGKWLVLYFYPKDDTPGCTEEACNFRDDLNQLTGLGAQVVGISVDNSLSHADFAKKYSLPFPLLADKDAEVTKRYAVLRNLGILKLARRYTFLIDPHGKVNKIYDKVATSRHSKEIIEDLNKLVAAEKR